MTTRETGYSHTWWIYVIINLKRSSGKTKSLLHWYTYSLLMEHSDRDLQCEKNSILTLSLPLLLNLSVTVWMQTTIFNEPLIFITLLIFLSTDSSFHCLLLSSAAFCHCIYRMCHRHSHRQICLGAANFGGPRQCSPKPVVGAVRHPRIRLFEWPSACVHQVTCGPLHRLAAWTHVGGERWTSLCCVSMRCALLPRLSFVIPYFETHGLIC